MMTEHEVRSRVAAIRASSESPARKARLLLRIGRSIKVQLRHFARSRRRALSRIDRNAGARLDRLIHRSHRLLDEVREEVLSLLRPQSGAGQN